MPLLPRLYSIASAQEVVGNEAHLTVANLSYRTNHHIRRGVCTHYLCDLAPLGEKCVPVYHHPNRGFTLPDDPQAALIMIGPGTGIAPYRGFLQARIAHGHPGRNWLFFGEWNRATDFFYEDEWRAMQNRIPLRIDTAFSRDQEYKIYVQHRMLEQGAELFAWLEEGAYLFVCGDANHMAKDVDGALHQIVEKHGDRTPDDAKAYLKELKAAKRYLRDVY
jgi:sulfite reductase (NADPH) flavoprotein alpha-component